MEVIVKGILNVYRSQLHINTDQEAILRYSLRIMITTLMGYIAAILIAWPLGILYHVWVIMMVISIFRWFSGGAHCTSSRNCVIYGAVIVNALGIYAKYIQMSMGNMFGFALCVFIFSLWAVNKYAPADTPNKPIDTKKQRHRLKMQSFIITSIWYGTILVLYSFNRGNTFIYLTTIGILWQSFTLTKTGYFICHAADKSFNVLLGREGERG